MSAIKREVEEAYLGIVADVEMFGACILLDHAYYNTLGLYEEVIAWSERLLVGPDASDYAYLAERVAAWKAVEDVPGAYNTDEYLLYVEALGYLAHEAEDRVNRMLGLWGLYVEHNGEAGAWVVRSIEDVAAG